MGLADDFGRISQDWDAGQEGRDKANERVRREHAAVDELLVAVGAEAGEILRSSGIPPRPISRMMPVWRSDRFVEVRGPIGWPVDYDFPISEEGQILALWQRSTDSGGYHEHQWAPLRMTHEHGPWRWWHSYTLTATEDGRVLWFAHEVEDVAQNLAQRIHLLIRHYRDYGWSGWR